MKDQPVKTIPGESNDTGRPASLQDTVLDFVGDKIYIILDIGLFITAGLMLIPDVLIFFFHMMFLLLIVGAFYWNLKSFVIRSVFWVVVTILILLVSIAMGETPSEEFSEIPLLVAMLLFVFFISRRRVNAEEELRSINENLESIVTERTNELTLLNDDLVHEIAQRRETETTLRESEERYRRLVELSFDAVALHGDNKIIDINSTGVRLLGAKSSGDIIGQPMLKFIHPDYVETVLSRIQQQTSDREKGVPLIEEKLVRLDGTDIDVEVAALPITLQGKPAIQTVIRDISARKRAEAEREQLLATERRQRVLAETLGDVFLVLAAQTSRQNVLDEILKQARRVVSYGAANIMLLQGDTLTIARHYGYNTFGSDQLMTTLQQSLADFPLNREVVQSRTAVVVADTHTNPFWVSTSNPNWIRSFVAVPICLGSQVLGLLRLDSETPDQFSEKDIQRLQPLAHAAAIVLENTRLYDQARQEIADRIKAEHALRLAIVKNQAMLDAIPDSIFHLRQDGLLIDHKIQKTHPSLWAQRIAAGSMTLQEIFPADLAELTLEYIALALGTDSTQIFEYEYSRDNSGYNLELKVTPLANDEALLLLADLTDYKTAQKALEKERARIARDLHDSLGQSLGYLRLKLDQYTLDKPAPDTAAFHQELLLMRDVANEAYEIVRSMLAAARPSNSMALNAVLLAQAQSAGNRARFKVKFDSQGQSRSLPPILQQQILFICHEALNNIEKHADASMVKIALLWDAASLTLTLSDDGLGFNDEVPLEPGHFGLTIMQERATEINGHLSINSSPGLGTIIQLEVPLSPANVPVAG
ncbi:MAG: hypothetical protein Kow0031_11390 [Anaerolineae bacterium]